MVSIVKAGPGDASLLIQLGKTTFFESHGHSAAQKDIDEYANSAFSVQKMTEELSDEKNEYYIIYSEGQPAGYSKIIFNAPYQDIAHKAITKLERIYILKAFYGTGIGAGLFEFNLHLSKQHNQTGMWLYVWEENHRAIAFYKKSGFKIIGKGDFRLTESHSNPNHIMFLKY